MGVVTHSIFRPHLRSKIVKSDRVCVNGTCGSYTLVAYSFGRVRFRRRRRDKQARSTAYGLVDKRAGDVKNDSAELAEPLPIETT
jgi:hypothetical protein